MASFLDTLAPNRVPDDRGVERRRGPADPGVCVRLDLQSLLNTRRPPDALTAGFAELPTSILNYGLRDYAFAEMVSADDRERLARHIADVIAVFEPRLTAVRVTPLDRDEDGGRPGAGRTRHTVIYFHIAARLVEPAGESEAAFSNTFEWTTGRHEVTPT